MCQGWDMEGFEVEPATLSDQAKVVESVVGAVNSGQLGRLHAGGSGSAELDRALERFAAAWGEGLEVMVQDAADLTDGMRAAARLYEDLDAEAAARLRAVRTRP